MNRNCCACRNILENVPLRNRILAAGNEQKQLRMRELPWRRCPLETVLLAAGSEKVQLRMQELPWKMCPLETVY